VRSVKPGLLLLVGAVWLSALSVTYVSHQTRQMHAEMNRQSQWYAQQRIEWGQLTLELGAVAAPVVVEQRALGLQMHAPNVEDLRILRGVRR